MKQQMDPQTAQMIYRATCCLVAGVVAIGIIKCAVIWIKAILAEGAAEYACERKAKRSEKKMQHERESWMRNVSDRDQWIADKNHDIDLLEAQISKLNGEITKQKAEIADLKNLLNVNEKMRMEGHVSGNDN